MAITPETVETYIEAANTALAAGSYATARLNLVMAENAIRHIRDYGVDGAWVRYRYEADSLRERLDAINQLEAASLNTATVVKVNTRYARNP